MNCVAADLITQVILYEALKPIMYLNKTLPGPVGIEYSIEHL